MPKYLCLSLSLCLVRFFVFDFFLPGTVSNSLSVRSSQFGMCRRHKIRSTATQYIRGMFCVQSGRRSIGYIMSLDDGIPLYGIFSFTYPHGSFVKRLSLDVNSICCLEQNVSRHDDVSNLYCQDTVHVHIIEISRTLFSAVVVNLSTATRRMTHVQLILSHCFFSPLTQGISFY